MSEEERVRPKPEPGALPKGPPPAGQKPKAIVKNPSTPGIQKPNRPDGRDDPPQGEQRG
jgi:hypothetical protein